MLTRSMAARRKPLALPHHMLVEITRHIAAPDGGHIINELYFPQLRHSPILQDLRIEELEKKAASMAKKIEDLGKKVVSMAGKIEELQKKVEAKPLKP